MIIFENLPTGYNHVCSIAVNFSLDFRRSSQLVFFQNDRLHCNICQWSQAVVFGIRKFWKFGTFNPVYVSGMQCNLWHIQADLNLEQWPFNEYLYNLYRVSFLSLWPWLGLVFVPRNCFRTVPNIVTPAY